MDTLFTQLIEQLNACDQQHVLQHWQSINDNDKRQLAAQIEQIDLPGIRSLFAQFSQQAEVAPDLSKLTPPNSIRLQQDATISPEAAYAQGEKLLRDGRVGVVIVAGGQGSRLGFPHPKGLFPIGPLSERTLFQFVLDKIAGYEVKYETQIPLFVMTSPTVHEETVCYFEGNDFFQRRDRVEFFCQPAIPAVEARTGKLLMKDKAEIFTSPNGHGGMLEAMQSAGILERCESQNIDTLFYGQIDNPLSPTCSPALLGYHSLSESQVTLQTIAKMSPDEKTGNIVAVDGRTQIIEYSEMPSDLATSEDAQGQLKFWAANIAVHVFQTRFLQEIANSASGLPYHFAHKQVAHIDHQGNPVEPDVPNAIKFERFIFDLLPLAQRTLTVEAARESVFAPVKNASSANFSTPRTSRRGISELHRSWLQQAGCSVADEVIVEIHPTYAVDLPHLLERSDVPDQITENTYLVHPEGS